MSLKELASITVTLLLITVYETPVGSGPAIIDSWSDDQKLLMLIGFFVIGFICLWLGLPALRRIQYMQSTTTPQPETPDHTETTEDNTEPVRVIVNRDTWDQFVGVRPLKEYTSPEQRDQ